MNEKIKELIYKADDVEILPDEEFCDTDFLADMDPRRVKIFAELIIQECIDKIESKRSSGENTDQWTITRDICYHYMMKELKEHFGVEEWMNN